MTSTAIATTHDDLAGDVEYAKFVAAGDLLPQAYRGKPANVLIAIGLGRAMGLTPAESLYRIDVIQGKPCASAELIAANVRKAGHTLRLEVDEQAVRARCTIIRKDDPGHEHVVIRDAAWAKRMGLDTKDNYKKQPATMLGWRALTACARRACSEALYGVAHSSDELADSGDQQLRATVKANGTAALREALAEAPPPVDVTDAEVVEDVAPPTDLLGGVQ